MPALLLDSASLYYRSYFALPESIVGPDGQPVNAVRGFLETVTALVRDRGSRQVVACWDYDWRPQWRVDLLPSYKTHRVLEESDEAEEETPDTLGPQIDILRDLLPRLGIPVVGNEGFEADDVIAAFAHQLDGAVDIASGDRDLVQLVDERVTLLYTGGTSASRGGRPWQVLTPQSALERFKVPARLYADFAILRGDPSDGLPGVRGIGDKTAAALVSAFGDVEAIIAAAVDPSSPKPMTSVLRQRLLDAQDDIRLAERVVRLQPDPRWREHEPHREISRDAIDVAEAYGVGPATRRLLEVLT